MSTTSFPVGGGGLASKILNTPSGPYNPPPNVIVPGSICPGVDTNQLGGVTVEAKIPIGSFGIGDVPVILPQNCRKIMLSSVGGTLGQSEEAFGLQIHFAPLGIDYVGAAYVNQGTEKWIQLHNGEVGGVIYLEGLIIEFRNPISRFMMDIQGSAGDTSVITWICADDVCDIIWKPQPSTQG